jgi:phosphoglycolate phosphatase
MKKPILVFDLDGTFAHTAPDLLDSLNHCLALSSLPPAEPAQLMKYVGFGGRVMIERALEARGKSVTTNEMNTLVEAFMEHYVSSMPGKTKPYDGVIDVLSRFEAAGFINAICTNKFEAMSKTLIEGLGHTARFSAICGQDTFAWKKPDPRHLFETIDLAGGDRRKAIMVGDTITDIDTAKLAGIPVIAVDFGYSDKHVSEFGPDAVISHFDELTLPLVHRLLDRSTGR